MNEQETAALVQALMDVRAAIPAPCNSEVSRRGTFVCALDGPRSWVIERWVREVGARAGVPVGWHLSGGIARVLALCEDGEAAQRLGEIVRDLSPALEEAARRLAQERPGNGGYEVTWIV
jgi:hypothetical protein